MNDKLDMSMATYCNKTLEELKERNRIESERNRSMRLYKKRQEKLLNRYLLAFLILLLLMLAQITLMIWRFLW